MSMPYAAQLDVDNNGVIDQEDLDALFRAHFGGRAGDANYVAWLDYNGDGVISASDLQHFVSYLGAVRPAAPPPFVMPLSPMAPLPPPLPSPLPVPLPAPVAAAPSRLPLPLLLAGAGVLVLLLVLGRPQRAAA